MKLLHHDRGPCFGANSLSIKSDDDRDSVARLFSDIPPSTASPILPLRLDSEFGRVTTGDKYVAALALSRHKVLARLGEVGMRWAGCLS
jgi:hypothetical protein